VAASDYGVNVAPDGKLTGYACGANVGWINFEQIQGMPMVDDLLGLWTDSSLSLGTFKPTTVPSTTVLLSFADFSTTRIRGDAFST
jgi:hypothetical protein